MELKANVQLTLNSRKDYLTGDNSDIIPTDTIKNTVHALAKLKGVGGTFEPVMYMQYRCPFGTKTRFLVTLNSSAHSIFTIIFIEIGKFLLNLYYG